MIGTSWELMVWGVRWMGEWTRHRAAKLSAGPKRGFQLGCILLENLGKGWKERKMTDSANIRYVKKSGLLKLCAT